MDKKIIKIKIDTVEDLKSFIENIFTIKREEFVWLLWTYFIQMFADRINYVGDIINTDRLLIQHIPLAIMGAIIRRELQDEIYELSISDIGYDNILQSIKANNEKQITSSAG